jgi:hydroxypyruvate isomerase
MIIRGEMDVSSSMQRAGLSRRQALASAAGAVGAAGLISACAAGSANAGPASNDIALPNAGSRLDRFTINIETWWRPAPLTQRIDAAARAGFSTVEMWSLGANQRDPAMLKKYSRDAGLNIIHCTVKVPDVASATPAEMRDAVSASLDKIDLLGARYGTIVGHRLVAGMTHQDMLTAYRDRLAEVAPLFEAAGVIACIEPFNPYNHPGYFINGAKDAVEIARSIGSAHVKLNWDLFHMQRAEGNVVHQLQKGIDQCALLQIADSPDRHEPGTGEMNYTYILNEARRLGFAGPIGLECFPVKGGEDAAIARVRALAESLSA